MKDSLEQIERQLAGPGRPQAPPLHLWHPPLSGDIDIRIAGDGQWFHEGRPIRREALVRLFASILRREDDGDYYLVTPVEKWRIRVEKHPLLVIAVDPVSAPEGEGLQLTLNTGRQLLVDGAHPLFLDPDCESIAAVSLDNGLSALFNRNAWYQLAGLADDSGVVRRGGLVFPLGGD